MNTEEMSIKEIMFWIYLVSTTLVILFLSVLVSQEIIEMESMFYFLVPFSGVTIKGFVKEMKEPIN